MIEGLPSGKEAVRLVRRQQVTDELRRPSGKVERQHRLCGPLLENGRMVTPLFIPVGEAMSRVAKPGEQPTRLAGHSSPPERTGEETPQLFQGKPLFLMSEQLGQDWAGRSRPAQDSLLATFPFPRLPLVQG